VRIADNWKDYEVLDSSDGEKLERWGKYILVRPDPQIIWHAPRDHKGWTNNNGRYQRSTEGGGAWHNCRLPQVWQINYGELAFNLKPMGFKHTGLFPEQAVNWDYMQNKIKKAGRPVSVLNMFAYTGGATVACAAAGASVCHVDASKGMVLWAKENAVSSGLADKPIRYIVDDCKKFAEREIRRGHKYDAIIMDPPSYGRGPGGEVWKIENSIHDLLSLCAQLLSDEPLFFLLNSYTTGLSASVMTYLLSLTAGDKFSKISADEIGLPVTSTGLYLPCGCTAIAEN